MAKLEQEDTDWVAEELPDWQRAIYTVNPSDLTPPDTLTTSLNKGHESMAYLTYVIDNYSSLPSIIAFIHPHRSGFWNAWHTDTPLHDNVYALENLQLPFIQQNGYVNLRCNWAPGCKKAPGTNQHITRQVWQEVFNETSTSSSNNSQTVLDSSDPTIAVACCAQFAVSRERIRKRPVEDYVKIREWVVHTELSDRKSGRVMEYLWHVIFGMDPV
ncbi:hypothetical protein MMC16_001152 [Acarospora aff. strigata]|nr:hypothetical protein [Acarospora aff. strigata]